MKFCFALLIAAMFAAGCASNGPTPTFSEPPDFPPPPAKNSAPGTTGSAVVSRKKPEPESKLIVTPENILVGTVAIFNPTGRFVVLDFRIGKMPARDQTMFVYRQGLKVGEVKITGPERDHNTVGDLISGEAQKGDEVRDR